MDDRYPKRPMLKWALVGSLALNLILAGAMIGSQFGKDRNGNGPNMRDSFGPRQIMMSLPREARKVLRQELDAGQAGLSSRRTEITMLRDRFVQAIVQSPFDPAALEQVMMDQHESLSGFASDFARALPKSLAALSDAERAEFAKSIVARSEKRRKEMKPLTTQE